MSSCAALDVVDNPPGIAEDIRPHLFEPFRSTKRDGLGIGLAYARQLARARGGDVYWAPGDPRGTRFTILFPAEPAAAETNEPTSDAGSRE